MGLKWRYVDLDKREIHVRYQIQRMRDGSGLTEAQPKQDEQRTVPFGERVAAALKAHRLHQNEERLARRTLRGPRPRLRHKQGHAVRRPERRQPLVQAAPQEGRATRHPVPRH